jgi:hypothetical protein
LAVKSEAARRGSSTPKLIEMAIAIILAPLILVTGSLSGLLIATVGLIGGALLFVSHTSSYRRSTAAKFAVPF